MKWIKEELKEQIKGAKCKADILRKRGLSLSAGNYTTLNKYIDLWNIDTSNIKGNQHGANLTNVKKDVRPLREIMIKGSDYSTTRLKKRLIKENILEYKCSECNIKEWNGKDLQLQLDHINGDNRDNRKENLRLLCPNCHSQTETFCIGKKEIKSYNCIDCNFKVSKRAIRCQSCFLKKLHKSRRKVKDRPEIEILKEDVKILGYTGTGKKYNVSDNAIRKWIKNELTHDEWDEFKNSQ